MPPVPQKAPAVVCLPSAAPEARPLPLIHPAAAPPCTINHQPSTSNHQPPTTSPQGVDAVLSGVSRTDSARLRAATAGGAGSLAAAAMFDNVGDVMRQPSFTRELQASFERAMQVGGRAGVLGSVGGGRGPGVRAWGAAGVMDGCGRGGGGGGSLQAGWLAACVCVGPAWHGAKPRRERGSKGQAAADGHTTLHAVP